MKISIVIDAPEYIGGIRYIERFVKILSQTSVDIKLTVIYVNCSKPITVEMPHKSVFLTIPSKLYKLDRAIARFTLFSFFSLSILKYLRESNVFFSDVFLPGYLRKKSQTKVIAWFPDFQVFDLPHFFTTLNVISRKLYIRLQLKSSDFLLTQSETDRKRMVEMFPKYGNKIIKWSFAEPYVAIEEVEEIKIKDFTVNKKDYLLYPHQGWAHKNHLLLINSLQNIKPQTLVLTGRLSDPRNPEYSSDLSNAIEKSKVKIINLGLVSNAELSALMKNAKAILNLSSYEGWASCVEEGIMMGTPLILSNIKIHEEQFKNAFFVDISSIQTSELSLLQSLDNLALPMAFNYSSRFEESVNSLRSILNMLTDNNNS